MIRWFSLLPACLMYVCAGTALVLPLLPTYRPTYLPIYPPTYVRTTYVRTAARYTKALFADKGSTIYRPRGNDKEVYGTADEQYSELSKTDRFRPEKDFQGVDRSEGGGAQKKRTGPVQYERDTTGDGAADPFGLDEMISKTKEKEKKKT